MAMSAENSSAEQPERKTMGLADLSPTGWFQDPGKSSLWISGYRMLRVPPEQLVPAISLDLEHVRLLFLRGSVSYTDASAAKIEIHSEQDWRFDASRIQNVTSPEGTYLLALAPYAVDGREGNEAQTRDNIRSALGLVATFYTKAAIYQHLFDNILLIGEQKTSAFSPVLQNPNWFPPVDLSGDSVKKIATINAALLGRPAEERNRIYLALRWLHAAVIEEDGVDSLLKYWVAIETLAMPDTTNILPANQRLAQGYEIELSEARDRFRLGRLANLRSDIVHNGKRLAIHSQLLRYVEYLFNDLLSVSLGVQCQRRAQTVIDEAWADLAPYLGQR